MNKHSPLRYRLALRLLSPVILGHLVLRALRDGGLSYFKERLGFIEPPSARRWIHCASVGEVQTVLPLLDAVVARETGPILLTTSTPTGKALLAARQIPGVEHRYLPLDFAGAVQRFVQRSQLETGWIMETEIWPSLFAACRRHDLKLTIINARLSSKSRDPSIAFIRNLYRQALESVDVFARSEDEAQAFRSLGARPNRVEVVGNLKFTTRRLAIDADHDGNSAVPLITGPYCIAASTHDDEEMQIARQWLATGNETLLVIAPRHPERGKTLLTELSRLPEMSSCIALRSENKMPAPTHRLYIADTIGELQAWYAHATAVFVGGSLIERGGQNMLEPVREGRPVVVGPNTSNFPDVMTELRQAAAIREASSAEGVVEFLSAACSGDAATLAYGKRAAEFATAQNSNHIVAAYLERLT